MMTTTELPVPTEYPISELFGSAWDKAVTNTAEQLGIPKRSAIDRWTDVVKKANKLGLRFDVNGNIINKED